MEKFEKNQKLKEITNASLEFIRKSAFSFIPAGPIFDSLWNIAGTIKQNRINDFSESVRLSIAELSELPESTTRFSSENFVDVFESIIRKVQITKSVYKKERFKNILLKQIIEEPDNAQHILKCVDLVDQLVDVQMLILGFIAEDRNIRYSLRDFCNRLAQNEKKELKKVKITNENLTIRISGEENSYSPYDIEFYSNELINKGLIMKLELDHGETPQLLSSWGVNFNFHTVIQEFSNVRVTYALTGFGHSFVNFIKS